MPPVAVEILRERLLMSDAAQDELRKLAQACKNLQRENAALKRELEELRKGES